MSNAVIPITRRRAFAAWPLLIWSWAAATAVTVVLSASLLAQDGGAALAGEPALSADRIISILEQQPELLAEIKAKAAARLSVDPSTITDDAIYDRIRQDPNVRAQITEELAGRGEELGRRNPERKSGVDARQASTAPGWGRPSSAARTSATAEDDEAVPSKNWDPNETPSLRRPSPYPAVPSLDDLYAQVPSPETKLKRFGSDVFRLGTGNANELPMDLPAGADYVLGPGDSLVLNLWGSVSERLDRTVDRQGQVALPEAGSVSVAGETIARAQEMIQKALAGQFRDVRVEISLARLRTVRVYVVGDVQRPGAYDISSLSTPLNALYAAGGPTGNGSLRTVRHYRGRELLREVDLYDFLLHGVRSDLDKLLPGDTILVPPVGPQVAVSGMVRRPAVYELRGEQPLNQVLDLAGGVLVAATLGEIKVERIDAHQRHTMLSLQLPEGGAGEEAAKSLAGFHVQDGDRVVVSSILPYDEKTVYLEGHVFRPGKYPYHDGMTLNQLLRSYQDLLPEPADRAEIIRLAAPDFRPVTIGFELPDLLLGDDPIALQPFDVIRIFGRYEADPPKVTIRGEVLRPGEYPLAHDMTAAGLVAMAGGFKRSAYREQADLSSYVVQNGETIVVAHRVIEIGKAMAGERSADVTLKPGDLVSIRQMTGWRDIGASVAVSGEVMYPGTYGITEGERLSSVLKRAGGFRPTAYPPGAVLQRVQVREMSEKARQEMIRQVEIAEPNLKGGLVTAQEQAATLQAMEQQRQQILTSLRSHAASGRLVIRVSADVSKWENTAADVEMRTGDVLDIPKRPTFVMVGGQVYNPTAISYVRGRDANWYLRQAGGPTQSANKKGIFILRVDGSVVGRGDSLGGMWKGSVLSTRLRPGDSIVVPEKISGGSMFWKNLMMGAQLAASSATVGLTAAYLVR
jgi:protein involved in polysaccharide export with SLBB domain